jgi:hypothetical protein
MFECLEENLCHFSIKKSLEENGSQPILFLGKWIIKE